MPALRIGGYEFRVRNGAVTRPHYGYCLYYSAQLAKRLGYDRISAIEFGVAGGSGLVNLEYHAKNISRCVGIDVELYGFDTGEGLPPPEDYRDLPYHWKEGFFRMDIAALMERLSCAKLVLGDIRDTVGTFVKDYDPAPIGAIYFDFDYYSSTVNAFRLLDEDERYFLPRVFTYMDDIVGKEVELYNEYTGVRLAINEFNAAHEKKKLAKAYHLLSRQVVEPWHHKIRILHDFEHSRYNDFVSAEDQNLNL